ncbi:putative ankyrin repeat protein [Penicillium rolfsii]|nr:putative ankyrin repeat protein [Penicillium rolfsii]
MNATSNSDNKDRDENGIIRFRRKQETQLLRAIRKNNIEKVASLLTNGASPDGLSDRPPLKLAVQLGRIEIMKLLFQYNGDDDELITAAYKGNLKVLKMLIDYRNQRGYRGNAASRGGDEPIHCAAARGHLECVQLLVEEGAKIDAENGSCMTPLHFAAGYVNGVTMVRFLVASGADVNALTEMGETAISIAASKGNVAVVKELLRSSPDLSLRDYYGETVLHVAAYYSPLRTVQMLVEAGADIHIRSTQKTSFSGLCQMLLEARPENLTRTEENNASLLHIAAEAGRIDTFIWVLENSSLTLNDLNAHRCTPLHYATRTNRSEMVEFLLRHGANISASIPGNHTPLHFAAAYHYPGWPPPTDSGNDDPSIVSQLTHAGADVSAPADARVLHFMWPSQERLCEDLYNISDEDSGRSGIVYPLHCAVHSGAIQKVKAILAAGADIHARTTEGKTALHVAAGKFFRNMIRLLIQNGADPGLADNGGYTMVRDLALAGRSEPNSAREFLVAENLYEPSMEVELDVPDDSPVWFDNANWDE